MIRPDEGQERMGRLHSGELDLVEERLKALAASMGAAAVAAQDLVGAAGVFRDTAVSAWAEMLPAGNC